ncbi:unnamed protein product [Larinioides sclopetarius]|uniref:WW domain-containing protein n=1 Tax=Larinioides sclopetarius TaxID=280406 RepID=A0AAV1YXK5_9ARAC
MAKTEILIEDPSLDYEINEYDILVYAKQIGIDIENEKHLMWIAEEGLSANVPEPWLILSDEKGRIFYSNFETGKKSWLHPLDKEYAELVIQERRKALNSSFSDCGFESKSPLNPIHDGSQSPGRFPKAPLPQLSSLSDAPPLSSSGKTTPSSLKPTSGTNTRSGGKLELGHFENRRGTKLAPVRLNSLKMPVPSASPKSSTGMSFMPKGSSLSRNIRRANEDAPQQSESPLGAIRTRIIPPEEDFNEDLNSDDESKYSYEETDDDMEKSYDQSEGGSYFSPPHSTIDSPEALDINSLVQLGTKLHPRKPLQQASKKKATPKKVKKTKKIDDLSDLIDTEDDFDSRIAALNEEQRLRFESIQKEWAAMLEELEKQEKFKYDKMFDESTKKFEQEKALISKENNEKLSKLKNELKRKVEEEENSGEVNLAEVKKANEQKLLEEEQKFKQKLDFLTDNLKSEVEKIEQKNAQEVSEKKKQLNEENQKEIDKMKSLQQENIKMLEESHGNEIAMLEETHKRKIAELQNSFSKEEDVAKSLVQDDKSSLVQEVKSELQKVQGLLNDENEKYQQLLLELTKLKENVASEREVLQKLEEKTASAQTYYEEIQDDVDKAENELDLLRNEKSALISELNVLKDNIKEEKLNLLKEKDKVISPTKMSNFVQRAVNTDASSVFTQTTQTNVETRNISCQIEDLISKVDKCCQVYFERQLEISNASCQVELLQTVAHTNKNETNEVKSDFIGAKIHESLTKLDANAIEKHPPVENVNLDVLVNKVMESALLGISNKIEARLKLIEEQLSSVKKESDPLDQQTSNMNLSDRIAATEIKSASHAVLQNVFKNSINTSQNNTAAFRTPLPCSSSCSCGMGDAGSCQVMQDVKNSIYRLNDILSTSFVPSLGNTVISDFNFPINNHTNSLQSFYSQFRQLQEKQRVTELKHKLQNGNASLHSRSLNALERNYSANVTGKETPQFNNVLNSSSFSLNPNEDPIARARNLVLREQARSWKQQQQYLNSSDLQGFLPLERNYSSSVSDNISHLASSRISSGLSDNSSTAQLPFLKFEPDPEAEYNEWMSRLKTLQDKIRSHKII